MSPVVDTKDLIDARGVAALLELSHPNSVSTYMRRYDDMPRPVLDLGGHVRLWLRPQLERWLYARRGTPRIVVSPLSSKTRGGARRGR